MLTRRDLIKGTASASMLAAMPAFSQIGSSNIQLPDLSFLMDEPLLNADRARYFMEQAGLDALVVNHPANVFYLSNHWPQLDRMGFADTMVAIFARDPARPLSLVMHGFSYYYTHSPESAFYDRLIFPYTSPKADHDAAIETEPAASPVHTSIDRGFAPVSNVKKRRKSMLNDARTPSASLGWALTKALRSLGLEGKTLGIDNPRLEGLLEKHHLKASFRPCENTIRRIRLSKSPAEIKLMRLSAQQNMEAGMAAALSAREAGSVSALRAKFFSEAERRGNHGVFMVVDGTSSEVVDRPFTEGMAFSIDCVSQCRHYHGDFARTIFVGEPHKNMIRVTEGIATAWQEIRTQLRPGMRFAEIPKIGKATLKKLGLELNVNFTPHSVGLFHTDHPNPSVLEGFKVEGLKLEENMIISVDCPPLDAGIGGTAHLEDLMLIKKDRAEPIHDVPPGVVIV